MVLKNQKSEKCQETTYFFLSAFDHVWTKGMILPGFKVPMLAIVMANLFLSAALFVGWPSILTIYKAEGVYSYLCVDPFNKTTNSTGFHLPETNTTSHNISAITCTEQSNRFTIIYTAASSCYYLGKLYFGYSLDFLGPKLTNVTANLLVFLGSTFLIFYQQFDSLIPGWVLLSLGGSGMVSCALHFANLFPSTKSFVLGIIPTALLISGFLLTIFQYLVKLGIPLYALFIVYSSTQLFFMIFALIWQPNKNFESSDLPKRQKAKSQDVELDDQKIPKNQSNVEDEKVTDKKQQETEVAANELGEKGVAYEESVENHVIGSDEPNEETQSENAMKLQEDEVPIDEAQFQIENPATENQNEKKKKIRCGCEKIKSVIKQMITFDYILGGFFLCIQSIIYSWYTGTLFDQFALMGDDDHAFATAFNFTLLSAIIFVPFQGFIIKFMGLSFAYFVSVTSGIMLLTIQSIPLVEKSTI